MSKIKELVAKVQEAAKSVPWMSEAPRQPPMAVLGGGWACALSLNK